MNIVIFSGGSGNVSLVHGLSNQFKNSNISIIINAYDNGKSTGVCRKITDTLGVSDIRKNHFQLYQRFTPIVDKNIEEFYNGRYNLPKNPDDFIYSMLSNWNMPKIFNEGVEEFLTSLNKSNIDVDFEDFSISNIVYSGLFKLYGYKSTIELFEKFLGIKNKVILNSYSNLFLEAITEKGNFCLPEETIVEWNNSENKIIDVFLRDKDNRKNIPEITPEASDTIKEADLIIISTGTFWSSIYPTFKTPKISKLVNNSKAKKIWIINNEEDNDSFGVKSFDFYYELNRLIDLSKFDILENLDAIESFQTIPTAIKKKLGNIEGKHDSDLLIKEIISIYFDFQSKYDLYMFDFDDTLWSRLWKEDKELHKLSVENMDLLNKISKFVRVQIVSGNSFKSIKYKISEVFGTSEHNLHIWADANSVLYSSSSARDYILHHNIHHKNEIINYLSYLGIDSSLIEFRGVENFISCISIKPIKDFNRKILTELLNLWFYKENLKYKATSTGFTTIDITTKSNNKTSVFPRDCKVYYVGDEIDKGNDTEIAALSHSSYHVKSILETNTFLKVLYEKVSSND